MAHLVPNPPPRDYHVPRLTHFTVASRLGVATVLAWGLPADATDAQYAVGPSTSDGMAYWTESSIANGPYPNLKKFTVKGLSKNDQIALFIKGGTPNEPKWVRFSEFVKIDAISSDHWAERQRLGRLDSYKGNSYIQFYPFGSLQRQTPLSEDAWQAGVIEALDKMSKVIVGGGLLALIDKPVIIYPWIPSHKNANSAVRFTAQDWTGDNPGESADEVIFHELAHVVENRQTPYVDLQGFKFSETDFLSVNATNVYSCLRGRGLRKDHRDINDNYLPEKYFKAPKLHYDDFKANYVIAKANSINLYSILARNSKLWNPFIFS
ncbi:hypothetical protein [Reyranella sp. CPCC 100927]|uniref:hypothetical protein n=1 Tax=Reyranella sp. CPCC 100927 TaxID=2599616 RepID=UPI0011B6B020|nr:hypothetical protein [Reyranella sp. CPCC 100927]TWT11655.1 hypothetical protein FQU96_14355 [Reyranella sp. CPCC 100927]